MNLTWGASLGAGRADYTLSSIRNGNVYVERWKNEDSGGTMVRRLEPERCCHYND